MLIRFAFTSRNELVTFDDVDESMAPFRCPGCDGRVTIRREHQRLGYDVCGHFTHVGAAVPKGGACEGYAHRTAKLLVERHWDRLHLLAPCARCGVRHDNWRIPLPRGGRARSEELVHVDERTARADVLIYNERGEPHTAIEILDSHRTTDEAIAVYRALDMRFVEVHAIAILNAFDRMGREPIVCTRVDPPYFSPCERPMKAKRYKTRRQRFEAQRREWLEAQRRESLARASSRPDRTDSTAGPPSEPRVYHKLTF